MATYNYKCLDCSTTDTRLAGLDDHTALCAECGGLALRTDEDLFAPLFYEAEREEQVWGRFRLGLVEGRRELEENP